MQSTRNASLESRKSRARLGLVVWALWRSRNVRGTPAEGLPSWRLVTMASGTRTATSSHRRSRATRPATTIQQMLPKLGALPNCTNLCGKEILLPWTFDTHVKDRAPTFWVVELGLYRRPGQSQHHRKLRLRATHKESTPNFLTRGI